MLTWTLDGPNRLPGRFFVAALGSAVNFSAGLALAYTGLIITNPVQPLGKVPIKIIPLRVTFVPAGTTTGAGNIGLGVVKNIGTCTADVFSGFSGIVTTQGQVGTSTGVAILSGTASWLNGTAGPSANGPMWIQFLGSISAGNLGANGVATGVSGIYDLQSEESIMPGESMAICPTVAISGLASIAWAEVPQNSGLPYPF
jgi:hypothetical protein